MRYHIEVNHQGNRVAEYIVEASDALTAINIVEAHYGEPAKVEQVTVLNEDGTKRHILVVQDWHGYMFHARATG